MGMTRTGRRALPLLALLAAGCGAGEAPGRAADEARPAAPEQRSETPPGVPRAGGGLPSAEARRVVGRWLAALRRGDLEAAANQWALPSRFQNGTPVLTIDTPVERLAIQEALPCGGTPAQVDGTSTPGYVLVRIDLTTRPGGGPASACGGEVRVAIQVEAGRITAMFRLDEDGEIPAGPQVEV
jgi:hypothetical protein